MYFSRLRSCTPRKYYPSQLCPPQLHFSRIHLSIISPLRSYSSRLYPASPNPLTPVQILVVGPKLVFSYTLAQSLIPFFGKYGEYGDPCHLDPACSLVSVRCSRDAV